MSLKLIEAPATSTRFRPEKTLLSIGVGAEKNLRKPVALAAQCAVAAGFLGLWEWAVVARRIDPFFYSQPSAILAQIVEWVRTGYIWPHAWATVFETVCGFVIGSLLGLLAGFALGRSRNLGAVFEPFIAMFNGIPRVVLAPLFLLWFGIGVESKVALACTVIFPIVFYAVFTGIREVDQGLIDSARVLGANGPRLTFTVLLPSATNWIFSSLRVSVGFAIGAAVVAEYLGSSEGIGFVIAQSFAFYRATGGFAGMVVLMVIVVLFNVVLDAAARKFTAWKL